MRKRIWLRYTIDNSSSLSHINSKLLSQLNPDEFNLTIEEIDDGEPTINFINAMANRLQVIAMI